MGIVDIAQLVAAVGGGTLLPSIAKSIGRRLGYQATREQNRTETLEQLVEVLRRAIDKVRLREDALAQVLGVLIFALRQVEDLSPTIADAIERAIEILEGAQDRLARLGSQSGDA